METKALAEMGIGTKELNELYFKRVMRELEKTYPTDFINWFISPTDLMGVCMVNRNLNKCVSGLKESMEHPGAKGVSPIRNWIELQFKKLDFRSTRTYSLDPTKDQIETKKEIKKRHRLADTIDLELAEPGKHTSVYHLKKATKIKIHGIDRVKHLINILQYLYGPDKIVIPSTGIKLDDNGYLDLGDLKINGVVSSKSYYLESGKSGIYLFKNELIKYLRSRTHSCTIIA